MDSKNWLLLSLLVLIFPFFFISGPNYYSLRSFIAAWNFGHIIFFAVACYLLLSISRYFPPKSFIVHCVTAVFASLLIGLIIEFLQYGVSRNPDFLDLLRNILGALTAVVWFSPAIQRSNKHIVFLLRNVVSILLIFEIYGVLLLAWDEKSAADDFPVLANFESNRELARWTGDSHFLRSTKQSVQGNYALKIELTTTQYSGVRSKDFPRNWRNYNRLIFDIYNPSSESISMTVRVDDTNHHKGKELYNDRFNRKFTLNYGLNTIAIAIKDIESSPATRLMDMSSIASIAFFTTQLASEKTIYLDYIRLD